MPDSKTTSSSGLSSAVGSGGASTSGSSTDGAGAATESVEGCGPSESASPAVEGATDDLAFEVGLPPSGIEPRSASGLVGRNVPDRWAPGG